MSGGTATLLAGGILLLGLLATIVGLSSIGGDRSRTDAVVQPGVTDEAFDGVQSGQAKEEVLRSLLPAEPLDSRIVAEYETRQPETPAAECVYFESAGGTAGDKYRFCFARDKLIDKTVILPAENGVASG